MTFFCSPVAKDLLPHSFVTSFECAMVVGMSLQRESVEVIVPVRNVYVLDLCINSICVAADLLPTALHQAVLLHRLFIPNALPSTSNLFHLRLHRHFPSILLHILNLFPFNHNLFHLLQCHLPVILKPHHLPMKPLQSILPRSCQT